MSHLLTDAEAESIRTWGAAVPGDAPPEHTADGTRAAAMLAGLSRSVFWNSAAKAPESRLPASELTLAKFALAIEHTRRWTAADGPERHACSKLAKEIRLHAGRELHDALNQALSSRAFVYEMQRLTAERAAAIGIPI